MPAKSVQQQRFFGLVRAVQRGDKPLSEVTGAVARAAQTMTPKDVREFAAVKHKGLPERKSKTASDLDKVRRISKDITAARRKSLEANIKKLREVSVQQQKQIQQLQQEASAATASASQAQSAMDSQMAAQMPVPPPAQVPYGRFLTGEGQENGDKSKPRPAMPGPASAQSQITP